MRRIVALAAALVAVAVRVGAADGRPVKTFELTASQFRFEPSTIEVDEGDRVVLRIRSSDVLHGFGIEEFGVKARVPPGVDPITVEFIAEKAGTFPFECTEFCGKGHPDMSGKIVVRPREGAAPPAPPDTTRAVDPGEPDFTLVNLPTTLRLPRHGWAFRVTHRFGRPLGQGDFGDLVGDLFGFDAGALVGLELRFGLATGTQLVAYRTNDRTIQLSLQHHLFSERDGRPVSLAALGAVEGLDNFQEEHAFTVGAVVARRLGERGSVYAMPAYVSNTNLGRDPLDDDATVVLGLGTRVGLGGGRYLVAEITPRVAGYDPGVAQMSFALEKRVGGHSFQIGVGNGLESMLANLARGAVSRDDWYIGFNVSRKFY